MLYVWHSEGCTARNEALMASKILCVRDTLNPRLVACMEPETFVQRKWFNESAMKIWVPAADRTALTELT